MNDRSHSLRARIIRLICAGAVVLIIGVLIWHVANRLTNFGTLGVFVFSYTIVIGCYVISRFVLAAFYRVAPEGGPLLSVAIVIPAYNEGISVRRTIDACFAQKYPEDKFQVICIDDGSTDDTWGHILEARSHYGDRLRCVSLVQNQGKRAAMAHGVRSTQSEIIVFVDSDSEPVPGRVETIVRNFTKPKVGAVTGHTLARNADENALTKMQASRYFLSFQLLKAAESVVGAVTCCSGSFSAYRREAVEPLLAKWEHQRFLGTECTYGDDRALTNMVIKSGWLSLYDASAVAKTDVPTEYGPFFRQQLRWKKSWLRESPLLLTHLWRSRPLAFPFMLIATAVGLLSPLVLVSSIVIAPVATGIFPITYVAGLVLIAFAYGFFHRTLSDDRRWIWAVVGTVFYLAFSGQIFWAMAKVRDGKWGTRGA